MKVVALLPKRSPKIEIMCCENFCEVKKLLTPAFTYFFE